MSNPSATVDEAKAQGANADATAAAPGKVPAAPGATETDAEPFDAERARETIRKQRESEKAAKAAVKAAEEKAAALEARVKEYETANLSATEREAARARDLQAANTAIAQERDTLKAQLQNMALSYEVSLAARELGVVPELAERLIDRGAVEYGDDGKPRNVKDLIKALAAKYPQLTERPPIGGGTPKPSGGAARTPAAPPTPGKAGRVLKSF